MALAEPMPCTGFLRRGLGYSVQSSVFRKTYRPATLLDVVKPDDRNLTHICGAIGFHFQPLLHSVKNSDTNLFHPW